MLNRKWHLDLGKAIYISTYPAFLTAPVQLKDAAAAPVCFPLYGEFIALSPGSSSSDTAVVNDMRSSSDIYTQIEHLIETNIYFWSFVDSFYFIFRYYYFGGVSIG